MSVWRDIKARLGFGDDYDDYDDYDDVDEGAEFDARPQYRSPYDEEPTSVRRVAREPDVDRARDAARAGSVVPGPGVQAVPQVKMQIVEPRAYAEVQSIADKFKSGMPVIMNLTMTDPELAKRFIDFASGLTYGLNGGLQKVSEKVFMLTPANVDVSDAQRAALRDRGLFGIER
ncbi:MAG TPA: cell division protein SepF [Coriobacteriia bacterium]|uniref:cell division protein SepF n=1 Tax=Anaerosoma tenue TaxID=2933588 RepID=UPI00076D77CC|nr:cell division protein SepF [Anaerosoma tenue]KUK48816.1 MAG: Cell division protein sepF [Actinobacteria bacterium 66_15]MCK8114354.1 cell division protein SepF [Anaerosoma tenue]HAL29466.1 cell division protein SepF [Coriobacteriia bacterium]